MKGRKVFIIDGQRQEWDQGEPWNWSTDGNVLQVMWAGFHNNIIHRRFFCFNTLEILFEEVKGDEQ